jgi:hypothetical protein
MKKKNQMFKNYINIYECKKINNVLLNVILYGNKKLLLILFFDLYLKKKLI